jgi:hypothetical protein
MMKSWALAQNAIKHRKHMCRTLENLAFSVHASSEHNLLLEILLLKTSKNIQSPSEMWKDG